MYIAAAAAGYKNFIDKTADDEWLLMLLLLSSLIWIGATIIHNTCIFAMFAPELYECCDEATNKGVADLCHKGETYTTTHNTL